MLAWYLSEHRELPFRRSRDRWPVLVAEVMLQQTQASRIAERFDAFMDRYPSPQAMAAVPPAVVLADWSGLGYNRRALHLHAAATRIATDGWPTTVAGLEALPGIGAYSARAIASIALGQPVGAVDTNVRRWLVRRLGAEPAGPGNPPIVGRRTGDRRGEALARGNGRLDACHDGVRSANLHGSQPALWRVPGISRLPFEARPASRRGRSPIGIHRLHARRARRAPARPHNRTRPSPQLRRARGRWK